MLISAGAAVVIVLREVAGTWATLIAVYLMIDRPDQLGGSAEVTLRIGVAVALAACVAIAIAGLRMRKERDS